MRIIHPIGVNCGNCGVRSMGEQIITYCITPRGFYRYDSEYTKLICPHCGYGTFIGAFDVKPKTDGKNKTGK